MCIALAYTGTVHCMLIANKIAIRATVFNVQDYILLLLLFEINNLTLYKQILCEVCSIKE